MISLSFPDHLSDQVHEIIEDCGGAIESSGTLLGGTSLNPGPAMRDLEIDAPTVDQRDEMFERLETLFEVHPDADVWEEEEDWEE